MIKQYMQELYNIRITKEQLRKQLKDLGEREEYLEGIIMTSIKSEGLTKISIECATAYIKSEQYPSIEDWSKVQKYVIKHHQHFAIIKHGISSVMWRELRIDGGIEI